MLGGILAGLAGVLDVIINLLFVIVLGSVIISWVGADPYNQIVKAIRSMTEPLYRPLRKLTSGLPGPIDWGPMVLILILIFLQSGIVPWLRTLSRQ